MTTRILLFNKTLLYSAFAAAFPLLAFVAVAGAQTSTKSFYNKNGSFAGSSVTRGNSSSFYNERGSFAGSAIRHGNSTSFYDGHGRYTGSSINTGPRR
jgi:hypothetical protein